MSTLDVHQAAGHMRLRAATLVISAIVARELELQHVGADRDGGM
jgi:hypothetical protein